mmetsp:Transcript_7823/g.22215  ORF Transcript_7823/g.22215 Transcript_7823/m.22215 type:complete len:461 (+) Transcript_7823:951-2333(+)
MQPLVRRCWRDRAHHPQMHAERLATEAKSSVFSSGLHIEVVPGHGRRLFVLATSARLAGHLVPPPGHRGWLCLVFTALRLLHHVARGLLGVCLGAFGLLGRAGLRLTSEGGVGGCELGVLALELLALLVAQARDEAVLLSGLGELVELLASTPATSLLRGFCPSLCSSIIAAAAAAGHANVAGRLGESNDKFLFIALRVAFFVLEGEFGLIYFLQLAILVGLVHLLFLLVLRERGVRNKILLRQHVEVLLRDLSQGRICDSLGLLVALLRRRRHEVRQATALKVIDNSLRHRTEVRLPAANEATALDGECHEKLLRSLPAAHPVDPLKVLLLDALQHGRDIILGALELLGANHALHDNLRLRVVVWVHNTGTVDEEHTLKKGDVLPDLGLAWDRCDVAHLLGPQSVDDGRLARVRVADQAYADLLLLRVQQRKLAKQLDERAFAERLGQVGVEGKGGVLG